LVVLNPHRSFFAPLARRSVRTLAALSFVVGVAFLSILNEGVMIEAADGKWELPAGEPVAPPFVGRWPGGAAMPATGELLEKYGAFLSAGAVRCRVVVPGRKKPLYGVLALLPVFENSKSSSARRTYRISIPAERIEQALGGHVSVVYEPYPYSYQAIAKDKEGREFYADQMAEAASWVLWISDAPFAGGSAGKSKSEIQAEEKQAAEEARAASEKAQREKAEHEKAEAEKAALEKAAKDKADKERAEREAAELTEKEKKGKKPGPKKK
jgi:hypothetical protein